MEKQYSLVVEGIDDERFLSDFISHHFSFEWLKSIEFFHLGGNAHNLEQHKVSLLLRMTKLKVGVVLDADLESFDKTLAIVKTHTDALHINEVFLFPIDHDFGRIETLLREIIPEKNKPLLNCIDVYGSCLKELQDIPLNKFDHHQEIFVYVDSIRDGGKSKGRDRNYGLTHVWDLDHLALAPLLKFIRTFLA